MRRPGEDPRPLHLRHTSEPRPPGIQRGTTVHTVRTAEAIAVLSAMGIEK